jgi:type I restriction enzyme S subunit
MAKKEGNNMIMEQQVIIDFDWTALKSKWIFEDQEIKLNASSYSFEAIKARELLELISKQISVESIGDLSERIFVGARVKRLFTNPREGIPYFMPIDLFMFNLKPRKWVRKETEDLENWWVKPFTILITQSGTPGRCILVNKLFEKSVISPNVIRIIPNGEGIQTVGYIYAYLNSWVGQAFLTKDKYGVTVKHIEPHHVSSILIPRIPKLEEEINQKILKAHKLRESAQEELLKAEEMIYTELSLSKIDEDDIEYFGGEVGRSIKSFDVKASEIDDIYRLDASYYVPILKKIKDYLISSSYRRIKLREVIEKIFIPTRFKRPYVKNSNDGIPFLQGAHIPMIRPMDVKYIWNKMKKLEEVQLKKSWVLMTRSGTVGRIGFVSDFLEGWGASEHILRIICNPKVNSGYIVAFLSSPYGEHQIKGKVYGAVVDEIAEQDASLIEDIDIILPREEIQEKIGSLVISAYNKKDKANQIEEEAIKHLEKTLEELAK